MYGWTYITARPGLLGLLLFFTAANFMLGLVTVVATPMILAFTSAVVLGTILSTGGIGMLVGSLVMSVWGGPKRRIYGVFGFELLIGLAFLVVGLRPSALIVAVGAFLFFFALPILNGSTMAIFQSKVAPDVQGRFFALTRMLSWSSLPLGYALAGPLADYVFEPLLAVDGPLAGSVGQLIGVGPGRGMGLMCIVTGLLTILITVGGYLYSRIRLVEDELPDVITDELPADKVLADEVLADEAPADMVPESVA